MNLSKLILYISILLIILPGIFLMRSSIFSIGSVDVEMEKVRCAEANQIRDTSKLLGQNFLLINSANVENNLKDKFICIKKVHISRYFPNKVKLQVFGREPAAILVVLKDTEATQSADLLSEASPSGEFKFKVEGQVENFVVDNEGVVYSRGFEQINAPTVFVSGLNLSLGQVVKENLITNLLKILERVKAFGIEVRETKIYSNSLLLINAMPRMIFRLDEKQDTQIASLQLILDKAKIDDESIEFIDLRFDKPVVRLAPKKR